MKKHFQNNWFHILIWTIMFIYLAVAPKFYSHFILKKGKPVQVNITIPAPTEKLLLTVDRLDPVVSEGQDIYYLWGWTFYNSDVEQSVYERLIVLQSEANTYFFSTKAFEREGVQKAYEHLGLDVLNSGFSIDISKDVIKPGVYHIGILFTNEVTNQTYYAVSNKIIVRTANQLQLETSPQQP